MRGLSFVALVATFIACGTSPAPTPAAATGREPECAWVREMEAAPRVPPPAPATPDASSTTGSPEPLAASAPPTSTPTTLRPPLGAVDCRFDAECAPKSCCPPMRESDCAPSSGRRASCDGITCPDGASKYSCACQVGRCTGVVVGQLRMPVGPQ